MTTTFNDKQTLVLQLEAKISAMKKCGKYTIEFLNIFGSLKNLEIKGDEFLASMNDYLVRKGF